MGQQQNLIVIEEFRYQTSLNHQWSHCYSWRWRSHAAHPSMTTLEVFMKREGYLRDRYVFNSHQTHKQTTVLFTQLKQAK